jgi:predicted dehydrogenase
MAQIRIAIVGTGVVAGEHHRDYHSRPEALTEVVALVEPRAEAAAAFLAARGIRVHVYSTLAELLAHESIDVVEICTPPATHAELIDQATAAGVAAISEKPLTPTIDEARHVARLSAERGVAVGVMQNFRYRPEYLGAKELMGSGAIGAVTLASLEVQAHWYGGAPYRMAAERMIFVEIGLHYIDLLRDLVGSDVTSVYSRMSSGARSLAAGETFGVATLGFASGATAQLTLTGEVPGARTNWGGRALIQGDEGVIHVNDPDPRSLRMYSHIWGGTIEQQFDADLYATTTLSSFAGPLHDYYTRWAADATFPITAESNLNSLAAALACYESNESGAVVTVD